MPALPLIVFDVNETLSILARSSRPSSASSATKAPCACGSPTSSSARWRLRSPTP